MISLKCSLLSAVEQFRKPKILRAICGLRVFILLCDAEWQRLLDDWHHGGHGGWDHHDGGWGHRGGWDHHHHGRGWGWDGHPWKQVAAAGGNGE